MPQNQEMPEMNAYLWYCHDLAITYPDTITWPGEDQFVAEQQDYFSRQQSELSPACFYRPFDELQLSYAVARVKIHPLCPIAVKGGGHASFAGASNTAKGITIVLRHFDQVTPSADKRTVRVGAGNRWRNVYQELERFNLTVTGGRTGSVGVGGFTLGGGISFFSGLYGLSCDNVANYRAILANGSILDVNRNSQPELYWALRGGGSNFAIVTHFEMYAIPHAYMWGGTRNYTKQWIPRLIDFYVESGFLASSQPSASQITTLYYRDGEYTATVDLFNVNPEPSDMLFNTTLPQVPYTSDTLAITRQSQLAESNYLGQPDGLRQTYWTATYLLDQALAHFIHQVFEEETAALGPLDDLEARCIMQIFANNTLQAMTKNGGNALPIAGGEQPVIILNPAFRWQQASDDLKILQANQNLFTRVKHYARERALNVDYLYMPYASEFQNVLETYGPKNLDRLRQVASTYDPEGFFQTQTPGYFKLNGRVGW
ncbi:FAD-binding oxidoreductase [Aspergillus saccharolyticus JOP 1030-1]|uniref:FAD-binding domain-containing protein n=1 Tax=Aspergillus saccharolyticus JOP 1030-1 TaxID=1450539 RepID=A0A318ZA02_9EURO|nr:FAD-binding domain-containing protein [Aspergillus saccharolyticus JOP 1030-1]PYH44079.1 FAD-binding domain-containing protein [Aspergillus saccharolyticus JOP 1030-1]